MKSIYTGSQGLIKLLMAPCTELGTKGCSLHAAAVLAWLHTLNTTRDPSMKASGSMNAQAQPLQAE